MRHAVGHAPAASADTPRLPKQDACAAKRDSGALMLRAPDRHHTAELVSPAYLSLKNTSPTLLPFTNASSPYV